MLKSALFAHIKTRKGSSGTEVVLPETVFQILLQAALRSAPFDEEWYLENNPDVQKAVASGEIASGQNHFVMQGYLEGRIPHPLQVDEKFYAGAYPDIRQALERGEIESLTQHFFETGRFEGRAPYANFSLFAPS